MPEVALPADLDLVLDGEPHHCTPVGDHNANKFWYRLHAEPYPHGWWGHYPTDGGVKTHTWQSGAINSLTPQDQHLMQEQARAAKQQAVLQRQELERQRRAEVYGQYLAAGLVTEPHGYLVAKDISEVSTDWKLVHHKFLRPAQNHFTGKTEPRRTVEEPALMLPLRTVALPTFKGAQYIAADGLKDFAWGLPIKGLCYLFGTVVGGKPVYLVEGAATGHVVHRLTGCATFACLSAAGMLAVAKDVRKNYGDATAVVVCAERGNGHVQGVAAAAAVQGQLCVPPWAADDTGTDFDDYCRAYGDADALDALQVWTLPEAADLPATSTRAQLDWVKEVNKDFFVALSWGAGALAAIGRTTGAGIALVDEKTLRLATDNHPVPGYQGTPYRFWLKSPARQQYRKVAYDPDWIELDREKDKNLWSGYTVEPRVGDWSLMRAHIFENIASGDAAVGQHICKLLAEIVQHPGRACGVALVLQGGEGAGKGVLANALMRLFGPHGFKSADARALTGEFTGHLENVSFFYADEMSWAGDHRLREKLWTAITDPTLDIHHKGRTPYIARNCLNFILTTNKEHAASISKNNRRLFMVSVRDQYAGTEDADAKAVARAEYFGPLTDQLYKGDGLAAMLHDLLAVDLKGFNAAAFPRTAAMTRNVMDSLDALDAWILAELEGGWPDGTAWEKNRQYQEYRTASNGYPVATTKFWRRLREVLGDPLTHTQPRLSKLDGVGSAGVRGRQVVLPPIAHARANASKLWGFAVGGD